MTLDEVIKHAEEEAIEQDKLCKRYDDASGYTRSHNEDIRTTNAKKRAKCAEEHRQLAEWLKELKQLREQTRWILCGEKMPEEHEWVGTKRFGTTISDEVYVTLETPDGERFTKHLSFQNGKLSQTDQERMRVWFKGAVPIAWMPLPKSFEPYKPESEKV